jgi:hypothetical protein
MTRLRVFMAHQKINLVYLKLINMQKKLLIHPEYNFYLGYQNNTNHKFFLNHLVPIS